MSRYSQFGNHYGNNEATATFGDDDIVDLVGGAHDAIERHKASYPEDIIKFTKDEEALLTTTTERATGQLTHDEVIPDSTPSEEELAEIIPAPVILNCLDADSLPELIRPYPSAKEAGPVREAAPEKEAIAAPPAPSNDNFLPPAALQPLMQFPKEHWDSPFLASQDNPRASMDTFTKDSASRGSSGYEPDMLSQSDDDLMFEVKKNPFQGFSPVADAGFSHLGDMTSDSQAAKMSESPTPDLVQYGRAEDSQDGSPPSYYDEIKTYESVKMAADSLMEPLNQFSTTPKESEDSTLPSLPDILKPFPLNPDKVDSGSSEGSTEPSPAPIRKMVESPTVPVPLSTTNPFAFDSKALLLKELTEETEARLAVKAKTEDEGFSAFDLVKEAEPTPHSKAPVQIEQKDWMFSSQDSPQIVNKLEPLNFQTRKTPEDSDSESPSADSLSPVLEAMAKNPASFQVESEKNDMKVEEPEAAEDISEPEVSSEEFEFIERPLRGVIDEFLEALDSSKFAKATEFSMDEDDMRFGLTDVASANIVPEVQEESPSQSSYLLLTQKVKSDLEKDDTKGPASKAPLIHSPVRKPELFAKDTEGPKMDQMPDLSAEAVVELLYWRDVKTSGVVFGAGLSLLLSLTLCSIVSVSSYITLALLSVTICFRIYKGILQAIQKSDEGHPFKLYLNQDVGLSKETVHKYSDCALARFNTTVIELRRLFLVEDLVDSLKFAVLMWILTYVGALFNGLTLLILGLVGMFSFPIIYEKYKVQIDHYVGMANKQVKDIIATVQAKVPGLKRVKAD
eukprot:XP_014061156.1 PREDICTED: reticulon-4 isoform X2 [Salmo salar]